MSDSGLVMRLVPRLPGVGREKPWHQDKDISKAFFDIRPGAPVVGLWIALDDTDPENVGAAFQSPGFPDL